MTRRALLIASQTYGLQGCDADAALMSDVLAARGFSDIVTLPTAAATRQAIVDALDVLTASIVAGDTAVVYYSGHGGRVKRPDADAVRATGRSPYFQFIVPSDIDDSADGDFRGLLSEELTTAQLRLTEAFRTAGGVPNVVTILDCCHSGYLARDVDARAKAVELAPRMFPLLGIVQRAEHARGVAGLQTNPDAVRLVACQPEQSAFELSSRGGRHGVFTDELAAVLGALPDEHVSWSTIADLVRRAVRARAPEQRPDVEGPAERMLFSSEALRSTWAFPVIVGQRGPLVEGAELFGLAVGDELTVVVPGTDGPLGSATVAAIVDGQAALRLDLGGRPLPPTAVVTPRRTSVPPTTVHVAEQLEAMRTAVDGAPRLTLVDSVAAASATVFAGSGGGLVVGDALAVPWRTSTFPDDDAGRAAVIDLLDDLAIGRRLLDLPAGSGSSELPADVSVSLSTVVGEVVDEQPRHGARLTVGTHVQVGIRNVGGETRYFWLFDVGISGRSALITAASGTLLGPAGTVDDSLTVWDEDGEPLTWPTDVPVAAAAGGDTARPETFVVVVADRRCDLRGLASTTRSAPEPVSALDAVLAEARDGVRSTGAAAGGTGVRYRLEEVSFLLTQR